MCPAESVSPPAHGNPRTAAGEASAPFATVLRVSEGLRRVFGSPGYKPPMLPSAALEIHELSCNPDVDTSKLIALLERDPMLAGQGLKNLGEIVFELALHMRVFRSAEYSELMEQLRRHCTACANVCRLLATRAGQDPENAFLCGLLHDIGAAAILIVLGERRKNEPALEGAVLDEVVRQTHEDVSGMLVRLWKLPGDVAEVVSHHHGRAAVEAAPLLSSIVVVADALSTKLGFSVDFGDGVCDGTDQEAITFAFEKLKLDATAMATVECDARVALARVDEALKHKRVDLEEKDQRSDRAPAEKKAQPVTPPKPKVQVVSSARKSPVGLLARLWRGLLGRRAR